MGNAKTNRAEDLYQKFKSLAWDPFDEYKVRIKIGTLVGGLPMNPNMIQAWVDAKNPEKGQELRKKLVEARVETLPDVADEVAESKGIGFARVDGKLAIEGRQVKAMLKEAANIIKDITPTGRNEKGKPVHGIKALKSKVADQVFVEEEWIPLDRVEPDNVMETPIHVMTAQGPRSSIKVSEVVCDVEVGFTVRRLRNPSKMGVPEDTLLAVLQYAQSIGLGAERSQGRGVFEVLSVEKINQRHSV